MNVHLKRYLQTLLISTFSSFIIILLILRPVIFNLGLKIFGDANYVIPLEIEAYVTLWGWPIVEAIIFVFLYAYKYVKQNKLKSFIFYFLNVIEFFIVIQIGSFLAALLLGEISFELTFANWKIIAVWMICLITLHSIARYFLIRIMKFKP